jgi:hypothetical protein
MSRPAFLFDRCFPAPIGRMLVQYETDHLCRYHDDDNRFTRTTPDVEIIATLAADTEYLWVLISVDRHITTRPTERAALARSGLRFFYLGKAWSRMSTHEQAWRFLREWPRLVEAATNHRGRVFEISGPNLKIIPVR